MRKFQLVIGFLFISLISYAQTDPINIVFDVTSADAKVHQSTVRHVSVMAKNYPKAKFEVVIYSGALDMILKDKSSVASEIETLLKNENVSFVACQMTLDRHKVEPGQLVSGVGSVPDGILELVTKQRQGWGYIKEAN